MTAERYAGNLGVFSAAELDLIHEKKVCVIGCGGLGGFVCNALARFGVAALTLVDGDSYQAGNLNRQLFAREDSLGKKKTRVCAEALGKIDASLQVTAIPEMLSPDNAARILPGNDLVIDCLDSAGARIMLEEQCEGYSLNFVHGAINGSFGQVAVVRPGDGLMRRLYPDTGQSEEIYKANGSPVFTAQLVSAIQCSEALKLLAGRSALPSGELLYIDLADNEIKRVRV